MCRPTYDDTVKALWKRHKERLNWKTKEILLNVYLHPDADVTTEVNLTDTIGKVKAMKRITTETDFYWLPNLDVNNDNNRTNRVVPYLVSPAIQAGFNLISRGRTKGSPDPEKGFITMICNRGKHHSYATGTQIQETAPSATAPSDWDQEETRKPKGKRKSYRPIRGEEEICKFSFKVYWNSNYSRYKIPKEQAGNAFHCGHIRQTQRN